MDEATPRRRRPPRRAARPRPPPHGPPRPTDVAGCPSVPKRGAERQRKGHITGIGGVFFRARRREDLAAWYHEVLGLPVTDAATAKLGDTVWAAFDDDTDLLRSEPPGVHGELPRRRPRRRHQAAARGRRHRVAGDPEGRLRPLHLGRGPRGQPLRALAARRRQVPTAPAEALSRAQRVDLDPQAARRATASARRGRRTAPGGPARAATIARRRRRPPRRRPASRAAR